MSVDLFNVQHVVRPCTREALPAHEAGDAFLAGGTWLFSEPQHDVRRLVDLTSLNWPELTVTEAGLDVAGTCTLAALEAFEPPAAWCAAPLFGQSCRFMLGSFKIRRLATVGGNLCLALPAAPMAALAVALHGTCVVWRRAGGADVLPACALIAGAGRTVLEPGDILRSLHLPAEMLRRRAAIRQASLTTLGRSASLLIGTRHGDALELTIAAAAERPVQVSFAETPGDAVLADAIDAAVPNWYDDIHGRPDWRRRVTHVLAAELCRDLTAA